jgi:hypothetical protein
MRGLRRRLPRVALGIVVFLVLLFAVRWWDFALPNVGAARYQAVFLSNGQTYFGRYIDRLGPYVKIENAYYIQTNQAEDQSTPPESRLIKRGNELHQPLSSVLIPRTAILFVEDLRPDSPIGQFMTRENPR